MEYTRIRARAHIYIPEENIHIMQNMKLNNYLELIGKQCEI